MPKSKKMGTAKKKISVVDISKPKRAKTKAITYGLNKLTGISKNPKNKQSSSQANANKSKTFKS